MKNEIQELLINTFGSLQNNEGDFEKCTFQQLLVFLKINLNNTLYINTLQNVINPVEESLDEGICNRIKEKIEEFKKREKAYEVFIASLVTCYGKVNYDPEAADYFKKVINFGGTTIKTIADQLGYGNELYDACGFKNYTFSADRYKRYASRIKTFHELKQTKSALEKAENKISDLTLALQQAEADLEEWRDKFEQQQKDVGSQLAELKTEKQKLSEDIRKEKSKNRQLQAEITTKEHSLKSKIEDNQTSFKSALQDRDKAIQNLQSRKAFLERLATIIFSSGISIIGYNWWQYKNVKIEWEEKHKNYKFWSTVKNIPDNEDQNYQQRYSIVLKPILELIFNREIKNNRLQDMLEVLQRNANPRNLPLYFPKLTEKPISDPNNIVIAKNKPLKYDFTEGVCSFIPTGTTEEEQDKPTDELDKIFEGINYYLMSVKSGGPKFLEEELEFIFGLQSTKNNIIAPALIFCLFFKETNKQFDYQKGYMYRYPHYLADSDNPTEFYEHYKHFERPYFIDFLQRKKEKNPVKKKGLTLKEDGEIKIWLSSVYSDFKDEIITPIRTLVFEKHIPNDGLFLFCIDFKFKDIGT